MCRRRRSRQRIRSAFDHRERLPVESPATRHPRPGGGAWRDAPAPSPGRRPPVTGMFANDPWLPHWPHRPPPTPFPPPFTPFVTLARSPGRTRPAPAARTSGSRRRAQQQPSRRRTDQAAPGRRGRRAAAGGRATAPGRHRLLRPAEGARDPLRPGGVGAVLLPRHAGDPRPVLRRHRRGRRHGHGPGHRRLGLRRLRHDGLPRLGGRAAGSPTACSARTGRCCGAASSSRSATTPWRSPPTP